MTYLFRVKESYQVKSRQGPVPLMVNQGFSDRRLPNTVETPELVLPVP